MATFRQHADAGAGGDRVSAVGEIKGLKIAGLGIRGALAADHRVPVRATRRAVLGYLLGHYLNILRLPLLLNAKASEQSARMVSMKNATDNAKA